MKLIIEDQPPFRSYRSTWRYRLRRFVVESEIPFALFFIAGLFIIGACFLAVMFMVG